MSLIYDHASKGTLTETHLSEGGLEGLEFVHPSQKLTPLGIAVWNGHTKSVELLLANGANPDGQPGTRPPLYVAVAKTRINVYPIVYALLNHGANPSLKSSIDGDTTPLLAAVKHGQSPSLVSVLVDAGASPRDEDAKGQTAEKWAEDRKNRELLHAMLPRASRSSNKLEAALMIAGLVLSVFAWTNKSTVVAGAATIAVGAAVSRRFKITGTFSLKPDLWDRPKDEFEKDIDQYIKDTNLDRFFPPGDKFLETVIKKAIDLDANPANTLDVHDLSRLALYRPILYCDDSASMERATDNRKDLQRELVKRIASLTSLIVPDGEGVELRLINGEVDRSESPISLETIDRTLTQNMNGWTEIGLNLKKKVLQEFVYDPLRTKSLQRPVLISIVTDGRPQGPKGSLERRDTLKNAIEDCVRKLGDEGYNSNGKSRL